jgi:nucleoid-associated protein YgaU
VFTGGVLEGLKKDFYEPPLTEAEVAAAAAEAKLEEAKKAQEEAAGWKSKFKKVESASPAPELPAAEAMDTTADLVQAPTNLSHARFKPVGGQHGTSEASSQNAPPTNTAPASSGGLSLKGGLKAHAVPKRRMRAEDMFGDSDDE